jgi:tRNA-intron endonuclease|tara:strand:- start:949 stop:1599 length:651 start_codon:yes stop_codon:yes gene_type:complete
LKAIKITHHKNNNIFKQCKKHLNDKMAKSEKKAEKKDKEEKKQKIRSDFVKDKVLTEISDASRELYNQGRFGALLDNGKVQLSLIEASYLAEKNTIEIYKTKTKTMDFDEFSKKAKKLVPNFWIRFCVYRDIRNRGYIIKTALKFGADFRVYDRGVKPGEDHAKWIVYPVYEGSTLTWYEFAAKNRVAHSTRKRLLLGVVDDENDVSYWECRWLRP